MDDSKRKKPENLPWTSKSSSARQTLDRQISRKLSKLRFTNDILHLDDFLNKDFTPKQAIEKLAAVCQLEQDSAAEKAADASWQRNKISLLLDACTE